MPRRAREKSPQAIYHIMCRSISEIPLFREDDDKDYYLKLLKRYNKKYHCSLYAYCLMNNHLHLHLDPKGFDISTYMHSINTAYVYYFNKKYERHGHIFQERFQSRILDSERYNLAVSAYIHNNPHDIEGYSGREETYKYSSYGIYLGTAADTYGIIDKSFVQSLFHTCDSKMFAKKYYEYASHQNDISCQDEPSENFSKFSDTEYISGRKVILRKLPIPRIMSIISDKLNIKTENRIAMKARHKLIKYRAFTAYILRVLCGLSYKDICNSMFNITISGCSRLCSKGCDLIDNDKYYNDFFNEILNIAA